MGGSGGGFAEPDDLFVLRGEASQGLGAEVGELVDRLLRLGNPGSELGVLCLEAGDLGFAGVGDFAGILEGPQANSTATPSRPPPRPSLSSPP